MKHTLIILAALVLLSSCSLRGKRDWLCTIEQSTTYSDGGDRIVRTELVRSYTAREIREYEAAHTSKWYDASMGITFRIITTCQ